VGAADRWEWEWELLPSIICAFQRISWSVRVRLAEGPRLPNSLCPSFSMRGLSVTISWSSSKKSCLLLTHCKRSRQASAFAASPASRASASSRWHRSS
jgi:hypothetical protein